MQTTWKLLGNRNKNNRKNLKNTFPHKVYKGAPPCLGAPKGVRMKKGKKMIAHSDNMSLLDIDVNKKGFMHAKARTCFGCLQEVLGQSDVFVGFLSWQKGNC